MRFTTNLVVGSALVVGLAAGCAGTDGDGGGEDGGAAIEPPSPIELPLDIDARCETDEYDRVGCGRGEGIPVGAVLVDDEMTVRYLGSSTEPFTTSDPVNTNGLRAVLFLEVENTDDLPQTIWHQDPDDRFDGTFERSGTDLADCGIVPRRGEIAPGQVVSLRFCGSIATVGEIDPNTLDFDLSAPCLRCGGLLAVDERLADPSVIEAVAESVDTMAAAGFGTAEELRIDDLDIDADDSPSPVAEPEVDPFEVDPSEDDPALPPPPQPTTDASTSTSTSIAPATTVVDASAAGGVAADLGLVLASDGLGLVSFDQPLDQTMAALTGVLGLPDVTPTPIFQPGLGTLASATWGQLRVDFQGGNQLFFVSYELAQPFDAVVDDDTGVAELVLLSWDPSDVESSLKTTDGIRIGTTEADAEAVRPTVYAPRCDQPLAETTLTENDGTIDQLFEGAEETGSYVRRPISGTIWSIGAQVRPNPFLCDGSTF